MSNSMEFEKVYRSGYQASSNNRNKQTKFTDKSKEYINGYKQGYKKAYKKLTPKQREYNGGYVAGKGDAWFNRDKRNFSDKSKAFIDGYNDGYKKLYQT